MWYFKTTTIATSNSQIIEDALRQFSAKRNMSLDFSSSSTYLRDSNFFLGNENEKEFYITRIRTPFERIFPKLILKFEKANGYTQYQVRLSLISFIVFSLTAISFLLNIIYAIEYGISENLISLLIFLFIILLFLFLEYRLTKSKLDTAIKKTEETTLTFN